MSTWNIPAKVAAALFVAGDARLGEDARPALNRVLETLAGGPPPAVELRAWIAEHARMGTLPIAALAAQIPPDARAPGSLDDAQRARLDGARNAMIVAASDGAAIDPRAPWGLLVLAATLAGATDGCVYDSGTLRIVPPWVLENPLDGFLLGSIKNHVAILRSTDAHGMQTATTLGLNKYGLFELRLGGVPAAAGNIGLLLAGLAQAVVDARPAAPGEWEVPPAFDVTRLHVAHAFATDIERGRGKTTLTVGPALDGDVYRDVGASHGELDERFVGEAIAALDLSSDEDEALSAALLHARRIARNRLSEARDAFARRQFTHDVVLVKKGFAARDASTAYLWLRVEDWRRERLSAIATSTAAALEFPGIGDRVTLDDDEIVDWRVERRDGEALGDFSDAALRAHAANRR